LYISLENVSKKIIYIPKRKYNFENVNVMMLGSGFLYDTVDKMKKLPDRKSKFKSGGKFSKGLHYQDTCKQNGRKIEVKEISDSELKEVINKIRLDAQKEKRKQRITFLISTLIVILLLIFFFAVFGPFIMWHFSFLLNR